jgi:hypothetical protein
MIRPFATGINLTPDGKIAQTQQPVRLAFQEIILAEVEGDQLISFCTASTRPDAVISVVDETGLSGRTISPESQAIMVSAAGLAMSADDFVSKIGIDIIRSDVNKSFLAHMTSGQAMEKGCGSLDMLIRGVPSILAQACCSINPLKFFEALERSVNFYPALMDELMPHAPEIARMAFRGEKAAKLQSEDSFWVNHCTFKLMKMLMVEVVVHKLNEGYSNFLDMWLSIGQSQSNEMNDFIHMVFHHPDAATIEAAELPHAVLRKVNAMGVQLQVSPMHAAMALGDNFKPLEGYLRQGYDWREIRTLASFSGDAHERLPGYLKFNLGAFSAYNPQSSAFWAVCPTFEQKTLAPMFKGIAQQDPKGFGQAFKHLEYNEQLACLVFGYVDQSWIDMEALPQAGLTRVLESDLGL